MRREFLNIFFNIDGYVILKTLFQYGPEFFLINIILKSKINNRIILCFKNIMYLWVGIPKTNLIGISANDLVQWEAIKWAQMNGLDFYEEMDAGDDPRLRYFKSKYNPNLVIWYSATKYSSFFYKIGETIFDLIRKY